MRTHRSGDRRRVGSFGVRRALVARYAADTSTDAGVSAADGEPRFRVLAASDREPIRMHSVIEPPCFA